MLLDGKSSSARLIAIVVRNPLFKQLLTAILVDWRFETVEDPTRAKVIFVERGLVLPENNAQIVWFSPLPLIDESFLTVPISLTRLYHLLEVHFFPTPRRHIRVTTDVAVDWKYNNDQWRKGQLISLSDRGGRFYCEEELLRKTLLNVEIKLPGRVIRTAAEVLYCVSAGDSPDRQQPQIGVAFKPSKPKLFDCLRRFIEKNSVEAACAQLGIALNDPCVSWIDFAEDPWTELSRIS